MLIANIVLPTNLENLCQRPENGHAPVENVESKEEK